MISFRPLPICPYLPCFSPHYWYRVRTKSMHLRSQVKLGGQEHFRCSTKLAPPAPPFLHLAHSVQPDQLRRLRLADPALRPQVSRHAIGDQHGSDGRVFWQVL